MNTKLSRIIGAAILSTMGTIAQAQTCEQCGSAPPPPPPPPAPSTETIFIMQGYSGKAARSPAGQGTSAIVTKQNGENVSVWGPGKSPHQDIHANKKFEIGRAHV